MNTDSHDEKDNPSFEEAIRGAGQNLIANESKLEPIIEHGIDATVKDQNIPARVANEEKDPSGEALKKSNSNSTLTTVDSEVKSVLTVLTDKQSDKDSTKDNYEFVNPNHVEVSKEKESKKNHEDLKNKISEIEDIVEARKSEGSIKSIDEAQEMSKSSEAENITKQESSTEIENQKLPFSSNIEAENISEIASQQSNANDDASDVRMKQKDSPNTSENPSENPSEEAISNEVASKKDSETQKQDQDEEAPTQSIEKKDEIVLPQDKESVSDKDMENEDIKSKLDIKAEEEKSSEIASLKVMSNVAEEKLKNEEVIDSANIEDDTSPVKEVAISKSVTSYGKEIVTADMTRAETENSSVPAVVAIVDEEKEAGLSNEEKISLDGNTAYDQQFEEPPMVSSRMNPKGESQKSLYSNQSSMYENLAYVDLEDDEEDGYKEEIAQDYAYDNLESGVYDVGIAPQDSSDSSGDTSGNEVSLSSMDSRNKVLLSGWNQLKALLNKNLIFKHRTPISTLIELASPALLLLILVAIFNTTGITKTPAKSYAEVFLDMPSPFFQLAIDANANKEDVKKYQGRQAVPVEVPTKQDEGTDLIQDLQEIQQQLDHFQGPLPIPTLNQFVVISYGISSVISPDDFDAILQSSSFFQKWGNIITLGTLHITPSSQLADDLIQYLNASSPWLQDLVPILTHDSEEAAMEFVFNNLDNRTWAVIDIGQTEKLGSVDDFKFTIRMNYTTIPNTALVRSTGFNTDFQKYYLSGFLTLQRALTDFAFFKAAKDGFEDCATALPSTETILSMPLPTPYVEESFFFLAAGSYLGLYLVMVFLYPTCRLIKQIVEEKESRMKQTLQILGLMPWVYWLSWVISSFIVFLIIAILITFTITNNIFKYTSTGYLFILVMLFCFSIISFTFFIASFFSSAKLAAFVGPIMLFATILPKMVFISTNNNEFIAAKKVASLFPGTAFAFGVDIMAEYEYVQIGVNSTTANLGVFSFNSVLGMLLLDTILYMFLAWYLDLVLPSQYGVSRPFYFLFLPSYWRSLFNKGNSLQNRRNISVTNLSQLATGDSESCYEPVTDPYLKPKVHIQNLVKRYPGAKVNAVDNLNLKIYQNQITCLLGHNGAGKSSTISVLTGLYPPTTGDCIIYGNSICENLDLARESMGICPQYDVLFDELTVYEHIKFFMNIKGLKPTKDEIASIVGELGLEQKLYSLSCTLSGGMKRKLSMAIAFSGNPKFVLLDEPTSAMDPLSRRAVWELLRKKKSDRVIILTTHYMEEAEILADRIAVLKHGRLQCCGSSLFLKRRYGLGYKLRVLLDHNDHNEATPEDEGNFALSEADNTEKEKSQNGLTTNPKKDIRKSFDIHGMTDFIKLFIPETQFLRQSGREVNYRFPPNCEELFPKLFDAFDDEGVLTNYGISSYGVTNTTLDDVFLQLADIDEVGVNTSQREIQTDSKTASPRSSYKEMVSSFASKAYSQGSSILSKLSMPSNQRAPDKQNSGTSLKKILELTENLSYHEVTFKEQTKILFMKRYLVQKRDLKGAFFMIILPVIMIACALLVLVIQVNPAGSSIEMSLDLFSNAGDINSLHIAVAEKTNQHSEDYKELDSFLSDDYPKIEVKPEHHSNSSTYSTYILNSFESKTNVPILGAFFVNDEVRVNVDVDWEKTKDLSVDEATLLALNEYDYSQTIFFNESNNGNSNSPDLISSLTNQILGTVSNSSDISLPSTADINLPSQNASFRNANSNDKDRSSLSELYPELSSLFPNNVTSYAFIFGTNVSIMHNTTSAHSGPIFNNAYSQSKYKACSNSDSALLSIVNHPLPLTSQQNLEISVVLSGLAANFLLIPLCYIPGAFIVFLVKENSCKAKHVQLVSGVNILAYWVANYLWDLLLYLFLSILACLILLLYGANAAVAFVGDAQAFFCTFLLIFGYGVNAFPLAYLASRYFKNPNNAQIAVTIFLFLTGFVASVVYYVLSQLGQDQASGILFGICRLFPSFNVGIGLIDMVRTYWRREFAGIYINPMNSEICRVSLLLLYFTSVPYYTLLLLLEISADGGSGGIIGKKLRWIRNIFNYIQLRRLGITEDLKNSSKTHSHLRRTSIAGVRSVLDDDVQREQEYVERNKNDLKASASILIADLWKIYPIRSGLFGVFNSKDFSTANFNERAISEFSAKAKVSLVSGVMYAKKNLLDGTEGNIDQSTSGELIVQNVSNRVSNGIRNSVRSMSEYVKREDVVSDMSFKAKENVTGCYNGIVNTFKSAWISIRRLCCCKVEDDADISMNVKLAVRGLYTAIQPGETFGLLGVNGAGKTTTLSVLTGDLKPTSGDVCIAGHDVTGKSLTGVAEARKCIGYCPQVNPLLGVMTARETLTMFGRLRGINKDHLDEAVESLIEALGLARHADKKCGSYSGGNKRKLCLGVAVIGNPKVLFIDEASSGMDPHARHKLWDLISVVSSKRSVVLTTHSMEEAEALCSRVAIMTSGQMRCIGSIQHLKDTYLKAYTLDLQCKSHASSDAIDFVEEQILRVYFPGSKVSERHGTYLKFNIPVAKHSDVADIFRKMPALKADQSLMIVDYSISQFTLEELFINLTKEGNHDHLIEK